MRSGLYHACHCGNAASQFLTRSKFAGFFCYYFFYFYFYFGQARVVRSVRAAEATV